MCCSDSVVLVDMIINVTLVSLCLDCRDVSGMFITSPLTDVRNNVVAGSEVCFVCLTALIEIGSCSRENSTLAVM